MMKLPGLPEGPPPAELEAAREPDEVLAPAPRRDRLSGAELVTIGLLETRGRSVAEIADAIGRSPAAVRANRKHAREVMSAYAPEMVELWIETARAAVSKGNHHPMRDFLLAAGVAQAPQQAAGPAWQVNIGIALPGLPPPAGPRTDDEPGSD